MPEPEQRTLEGRWQYGRFYGPEEKYPFPIDKEEQCRMDIVHKFFLVVNHNKTHSRPLRTDRRPRVLDLGAGTAIWGINLAEDLKEVEVVGVDLNLIQPPLIPRGMSMMQYDIEARSWDALMWDCDLIFMRCLFGSININAWPDIYRNALLHLAPGRGYVEITEIDWTPQWDDNSPRANPSPLQEWSDKIETAMVKLDRTSKVIPQRTRRLLEDAGFGDIREEVRKFYINPWSKDKYERETARWFNLAFNLGTEAMSLRPLVELEGMTAESVKELCADVKRETCTLRYHVGFNVYVWTAKRPASG